MTGLKHAGVVILPADLNGLPWIEFLRELGLNTLGIHSGGGTGEQVLEKLGDTARADFRQKACVAGLQLEYELHAGSSLLPRELFASQPECFVFDAEKSRRIPDYNFCPTHPEAMKIVTQNARRLAAQLKPSTGRHFFWSDDGFPWCRCRRCADLTNSDQELMVANAICLALRQDNPQACVAYLAYLCSLEAPRTIKPEPGVFLEFAPIRRSLTHPIDDPSCEENRKHWDALLKLLTLFSAAEAHVLEYWLDSSLASEWRRPARKVLYKEEVVARDVKAYCALGIQSITTFAAYIDGEYVARYGDADVCGYARHLAAMR